MLIARRGQTDHNTLLQVEHPAHAENASTRAPSPSPESTIVEESSSLSSPYKGPMLDLRTALEDFMHRLECFANSMLTSDLAVEGNAQGQQSQNPHSIDFVSLVRDIRKALEDLSQRFCVDDKSVRDTPLQAGGNAERKRLDNPSSLPPDHQATLQGLVQRVIRHDTAFIHRLQDECDTSLVFAALFSAIITAFLGESYKELRPNDIQPAVDALLVLVQAIAPNSAESSLLPPSSIGFSARRSVQTTNRLWFIALTNSLFVALMSMLMKQWLRENLGWSNLSDEVALRVRQMRWEQLQDRHIEFKVTLLPTLLQISVILFISGLIVFLFDIDKPVAQGVIVVAAFFASALLYFTLHGVFVVASPYRSSLILELRDLVVKLVTTVIVVVPHQTVRAVRWVLSPLFPYRRLVRGYRPYKRETYLSVDVARAKRLASRGNVTSPVDPLNGAFGWMNVNFTDRATTSKLRELCAPMDLYSFVLDGGRYSATGSVNLPQLLIHDWPRTSRVRSLDVGLLLQVENLFPKPFCGAISYERGQNNDSWNMAVLQGLGHVLHYHQKEHDMSFGDCERVWDLYWKLHSKRFSEVSERATAGISDLTEFLWEGEGREATLTPPPLQQLLIVMESGVLVTAGPLQDYETQVSTAPIDFRRQKYYDGYWAFRIALRFFESYESDSSFIELSRTVSSNAAQFLRLVSSDLRKADARKFLSIDICFLNALSKFKSSFLQHSGLVSGIEDALYEQGLNIHPQNNGQIENTELNTVSSTS